MSISPRIFSSWILAASMAFGSSGCGKDEPIGPGSNSTEREGGASNNTSGGNTDTDQENTDETDGVPTRPTTSSTAPSPPPVTASNVGKRCDLDADCAGDLRCLTVDSDEWLEGGVANGYCTQDCSADRTVCGSALCLPMSDTEAYCVERCELGSPLLGCHGREDLSCSPLRATDGSLIAFCSPTCRSDADCAGRKCDLGWGNCIDELPPGAPIGAKCEQDTDCQTELCFPTELADGSQHSVCSGLCTLGATAGCGLEQNIAEEPGEPLCFPPISGLSTGDLGLCRQTCNCNEHCLHPDAVCLIFPEESNAQSAFGTDGICIEPVSVPEEDLDGFVLGRACPPGPDSGDGGMSSLPDPDDAGTESPVVVPDASTLIDSSTAPVVPADASGDR